MLKTPKGVCSLQHLTYLSTGIPSSSPTRTPDPNEETGGNHHAKPKFMKHLTTIYPYEPSITHHPHLMQPWIILNPSNHPFFEHVISPSNHIIGPTHLHTSDAIRCCQAMYDENCFEVGSSMPRGRFASDASMCYEDRTVGVGKCLTQIECKQWGIDDWWMFLVVN